MRGYARPDPDNPPNLSGTAEKERERERRTSEIDRWIEIEIERGNWKNSPRYGEYCGILHARNPKVYRRGRVHAVNSPRDPSRNNLSSSTLSFGSHTHTGEGDSLALPISSRNRATTINNTNERNMLGDIGKLRVQSRGCCLRPR